MSKLSVEITLTPKLKKFKGDKKVWNAMKRRLKTGMKQSAEVGWFSGNIHIGSDGQLDLPTAQIAKWNEEGHWTGGKYGVHFVPPRHFIRTGFMFLLENGAGTKRLLLELTKAVAEGRLTWNGAYIRLGQSLIGKMQKAIELDIYVSNTPFTIELKGHSQTLINTRQMLEKVEARVGRKRA